ncbi:bifunctional phosphopantothenoylcysteine decarboxylase/phosphopantothenate--cysteine ligase CoaBC [candidate division WOR-3 bacterium]|nr:bifunctional phosphopantothenoylcysteine decarboxylase/phosphopantothenate--cysteine ligase CoaBC [candidate division WOR-3 bacterium]
MKITLGITGSISAYKSIYILREFKKRGNDIYCALTHGANHFVSPLTLSVLSGHRVFEDAYVQQEQTVHIKLASNDLILIVPATYNIIGKINAGIADDLLTSIVAATTKPVFIAPAMNPHMWQNPIIQDNIKRLIELGYFILKPERGEVACGDKGEGRLQEPLKIVDYVYKVMKKSSTLSGVKILVTTGRTEEEIDPIRVISNRSSGIMGYEIAKEAKQRGAIVTIVKGATDIPITEGIRIHNTKELESTLLDLLDNNDIVIMTAAVSDYRPVEVSEKKLRRKDDKMTLHLKKTEDILKRLRKKREDKMLIGFSVGDNYLIKESKRKIIEKSLDIIVANPCSVVGSHNTEFTIIGKDSKCTTYPKMAKREAAHIILDSIEKIWKKR